MMKPPRDLSIALDSDYNPTDLSIFSLIDEYRPNLEKSYHCDGGTRVKIPEDATILMEEPFVAYYHPTRKGNVGYLRIPDYSPPDDAYDEYLEYYRWALTILEEKTVGLIIDQDHNCGGSPIYLEELIALFMNRPFMALPQRFRASKYEILKWKNWMNEWMPEHTLLHEGIKEAWKILKETHSKGLYLTPMTSMRGSIKVQPQNIYTKPVIILIDYFAGSGGDAFPSMMQGFGRAKLLGSTTMGLGGYVSKMEPLMHSRIRTRMTQSLFFAPDFTPVENHGAIPNIPYEITLDDFVNEYQDYQEFYLNELLKRIK